MANRSFLRSKEVPTYGSKVVAHTVSQNGNEIITWELCLPKWLLAEFNTHKVEIERNSASSRAVPTGIILDMVTEFPVMPLDWRANSKGMVPEETLDDEDIAYLDGKWLEARDFMVDIVNDMMNLPSGRKPDKQRVNRLLEPWMWAVVVCTMTSGGGIGMNNFFGLRDTKDAQPEFAYVAHMMHEQWHHSVPVSHTWHLPYVDIREVKVVDDGWMIEDYHIKTIDELWGILALRSSARCGRVTHYRQGQEFSIQEDITRAQSFAENGHYSPLRHAAMEGANTWYGNFYGWIQFSKIMLSTNDYVTKCCDRPNRAKPITFSSDRSS